MSFNIIKAILEVGTTSLSEEHLMKSSLAMVVEFNKKYSYYSLIGKLIENFFTLGKRRLMIVNFDISFYRWFSKNNIDTYKKLEGSFVTFINVFDFTSICSLNLKFDQNSTVLILGLDTIPEKKIHQFFYSNRRILNDTLTGRYTYIYIISTDNSRGNLTSEIEKKKDIIRSKSDIYIAEKASKVVSSKEYFLMEISNFKKLSKELCVFEYIVDNSLSFPTFEKISLYLKEQFDIFESKRKEEPIMPLSTFNLELKENELQAKNEMVLPYIKSEKEKEKQENRIIIDSEDLNELYEEDPDEDLDI